MADTSPPADLLGRAGRVISLARQLAHSFTEEYDRHGAGHRVVDQTAWGRHEPAFKVFCDALIELRDDMQNPPDGYASIADVLMEAARVAKQIRDTMGTSDGQTWQSFLDFRFHLNSIVAKGDEAVRAATKARRLDDPFAFVDRPAVAGAPGIDTTPTLPQPPAASLDGTARAIPAILANVPPQHDGTMELVAAQLVKRLQDAGHTLAAAQWAIHKTVQAGRLRAGLVEVELPVVHPLWSSGHGPAPQQQGVRRGTKPIPKGKPAPFDCFKVVATAALWEWWRSLEAPQPREEPTYDPCDREPRTFGEWVTWMAYYADFNNPRRTGLRPPTRAHSPDHHYLESYCKEMFGAFDLDALGKLRARYIVQTSKTVEQIDATTLRALADHFRTLTHVANAGAGPQDTGAHGQVLTKTPQGAAAAAETLMAVVQLYAGGAASNDRIQAVAAVINNPDLTVNQKLTQIDRQLPIPAAVSGEKLGALLDVTKTAVVTSEWWKKNRSGKRQDEESRRLARHEKRKEEFEPPGRDDGR